MLYLIVTSIKASLELSNPKFTSGSKLTNKLIFPSKSQFFKKKSPTPIVFLHSISLPLKLFKIVDPLLSWSRYLEQLQPWFTENLSQSWVENVHDLLSLLKQGDNILHMIQVTGEEGVSTEDFVIYQQALFFDMVYLQQDAFDPVDVAVPLARQKESLNNIVKLINTQYQFSDKDAVRDYFTKLTGLFKNLNYSPSNSNEYSEYIEKIEALRKSAMKGNG